MHLELAMMLEARIKRDVYLRHKDKTFVVAIGSGIMVQSRGIGH